MSRRFPKEVHDFIADNVYGRKAQDLAKLVNERFGEELFTVKSMKSYKSNHRLRSDIKCGGRPKLRETRLYPLPVMEYIYENYIGVGPTEMTERLNEKFGTTYTVSQLQGFYANRKLNSGLTGRFEKGRPSMTKGMKRTCSDKCSKTWFKVGGIPHNKLPVGTVIKKNDGYLWRKIKDGCKGWKQEHLLVWESANGPVPEGCHVGFKNCNKENVALENLMLLTKSENSQLNNRKLRFSDPKLTELGLMITKLDIAVKEQAKKVEDGKR